MKTQSRELEQQQSIVAAREVQNERRGGKIIKETEERDRGGKVRAAGKEVSKTERYNRKPAVVACVMLFGFPATFI